MLRLMARRRLENFSRIIALSNNKIYIEQEIEKVMANKERGIVQVPGKALTQTDGPWNKISAILRDATDDYTSIRHRITA